MKQLLILTLILSSIICFGQKKEVATAKNTQIEQLPHNFKEGNTIISVGKVNLDSAVNLPEWHKQQVAFEDAEIKRLQSTTIEAEVQRHAQRKEDLLTSFFLGRIDPNRIEPGSIKIEGDQIKFRFKPKNK